MSDPVGEVIAQIDAAIRSGLVALRTDRGNWVDRAALVPYVRDQAQTTAEAVEDRLGAWLGEAPTYDIECASRNVLRQQLIRIQSEGGLPYVTGDNARMLRALAEVCEKSENGRLFYGCQLLPYDLLGEKTGLTRSQLQAMRITLIDQGSLVAREGGEGWEIPQTSVMVYTSPGRANIPLNGVEVDLLGTDSLAHLPISVSSPKPGAEKEGTTKASSETTPLAKARQARATAYSALEGHLAKERRLKDLKPLTNSQRRQVAATNADIQRLTQELAEAQEALQAQEQTLQELQTERERLEAELQTPDPQTQANLELLRQLDDLIEALNAPS